MLNFGRFAGILRSDDNAKFLENINASERFDCAIDEKKSEWSVM